MEQQLDWRRFPICHNLSCRVCNRLVNITMGDAMSLKDVFPRVGKIGLVFASLAVLAVVLGCSRQPPASPKGLAENESSLIEKLRGQGLRVVREGSIKQVFFDPTGRIVSIEGSEVQVFEFKDEKAARQAAAGVSPDGTSVGPNMITWVSTPHFYQKGKLIVIHVGKDLEILRSLQGILGRQFAGD